MFSNKSTDVEQWLMAAHDAVRVECRFDQRAMARKMAEYLGQDRRFDGIADKEKFATEVFECRRSGRELDLSKRMRIDSAGGQTAGIIGRW
jgi:hypothetical protein